MGGWISIHRKIQDHWLWKEKPFDKKSAWVDLVLLANYKDNKVLLGNELIEVKRGSFITSELKLMNRWGWSKTKVRNFLNLLEKENMVFKKSDRKKTTLTIVNYNDYQDIGNHEETTKRPPKDHEETTKRLLKDTNNKDNKDNKDNNIKPFMEIKNFRQRYTEEQLKIIDNYFDILRWTRKHGKIAESVICGIYKKWKEFNPVIVIHALGVYIKNPKHHDKKENYCYGIMRNTTMEEVERAKEEGKKTVRPLRNKTRFHLTESRGDKYEADELEELLLQRQKNT